MTVMFGTMNSARVCLAEQSFAFNDHHVRCAPSFLSFVINPVSSNHCVAGTYFPRSSWSAHPVQLCCRLNQSLLLSLQPLSQQRLSLALCGVSWLALPIVSFVQLRECGTLKRYALIVYLSMVGNSSSCSRCCRGRSPGSVRSRNHDECQHTDALAWKRRTCETCSGNHRSDWFGLQSSFLVVFP